MFIKFYLIIFFLSALSFGNDINEQIDALKSVSGNERVEMMNRIKTQIAAMNEHERAEAIQMLQSNMKQTKAAPQNHMQHMMNQDRHNNTRQIPQQKNQGAK